MGKIIDINQNTPEWHEWRAVHLGGSDASVVMWVNPYKEPYKLWLEKTGRVAEKAQKNGRYETPAQRGLRLEAETRKRYCMDEGVLALPACVENERAGEQFMSASLDGICDDRIIEIKNPTDKKTHVLAKDGLIPAMYYAQCQHNLHCAGMVLCDYVSRFEDEIIVVPVAYDAAYAAELVAVEQHFWAWVTDNVFPFPSDSDLTVDLTNDEQAMATVRRLIEAEAMLDVAEERVRTEKALLKRRLMDAGRAFGPGIELFWRKQRGPVKWEDIPEVKALGRDYLEQFRGPEQLKFFVARK